MIHGSAIFPSSSPRC